MDQSEWKIAKRLYFSEEGKARTSRPAVRVALGGEAADLQRLDGHLGHI